MLIRRVWLRSATRIRKRVAWEGKNSCSLSCFFASPTFLAAFVRSSCWIYSLSVWKKGETSPSRGQWCTSIPVVSNGEHPRFRHDVPQVGPIETIGELKHTHTHTHTKSTFFCLSSLAKKEKGTLTIAS